MPAWLACGLEKEEAVGCIVTSYLRYLSSSQEQTQLEVFEGHLSKPNLQYFLRYVIHDTRRGQLVIVAWVTGLTTGLTELPSLGSPLTSD